MSDSEKPQSPAPETDSDGSTPPEAEAAPEKAEAKDDAKAEEASADAEAKGAESATDEAPADAGDGDESGDAEAEKKAEPAKAEPTLEEKLATAKADHKRVKEKMLRVAADFENFRRRHGKEVDDARRRGRQKAVKDLLPIFDNLERATAAADDSPAAKSIADGVRMVHKMFIDTIGKMGITRVESIGKGFDPNVHDSIQYDHSDEHPPGVVMAEVQPGYVQGKELLRAAMVVVSRGPAPSEEAKKADDAKADDAKADDAKADDAKADDAKADDAKADDAKADDAKADDAKADDAKADDAKADDAAETADGDGDA